VKELNVTIEERVAKLERKLAHLKSELVDCVRTRCVRVVDGQNKVRAQLKVEAEEPALNLFDENGNVRAELATRSTMRRN
jgi:hypothetical protein